MSSRRFRSRALVTLFRVSASSLASFGLAMAVSGMGDTNAAGAVLALIALPVAVAATAWAFSLPSVRLAMVAVIAVLSSAVFGVVLGAGAADRNAHDDDPETIGTGVGILVFLYTAAPTLLALTFIYLHQRYRQADGAG